MSSVVPSTPVPAGWYADPEGAYQQRWWDGERWTAEVRPYPANPSPAPPSPIPPPLPSRRELRGSSEKVIAASPFTAETAIPRQFTAETALPTPVAEQAGPPFMQQPAEQTVLANSATGVGVVSVDLNGEAIRPGPQGTVIRGPGPHSPGEVPYTPFGMRPRVTEGTLIEPWRLYTGWVWLLATMPLLVAAGWIGIVVWLQAFTSEFMIGGLLALLVITTVWFVVRDRRMLLDSGYTRAASTAWILLSPLAYLIARWRHTRSQLSGGAAPLVTWLLSIVLATAAIVFLPSILSGIVLAS